MNRILSATLAAVTVLALSGTTLRAQGMHHKGKGMMMHHQYDPKTVETLEGEVTAVDFTAKGCCGDRMGGTHITLKTSTASIMVYAGPSTYLEDKITLTKGDVLEVTGSRVVSGEKPVIIARSLKKGEITVTLRKDNGTPMWAGEGMRGNRAR
jgi:hypothetical protein